VGFPGESDADFEETMDVIDQVRFEQIFSFKYSPRPETKAAEFTNVVESSLSSERLTRVQTRQDVLLDEIAQATQGKIYEVYFEELRNNGGVAGRASNGFMVQVEGSEELLGQMKPVRISNPRRKVLYGKVVQ
jgi:tRNA-2-methylthio-N6-dimethylallyladenosine synthase